MGYQFIHLEAYARKNDKAGRSVGWVLDEAAREPGASPHVAQPLPPEIVHGAGLEEVRRLHDEACANTKVVLANGKERAVRKDQKSLLTIVASHPASMDCVRADTAVAADVSAWESRTLEWLRAQYGDNLLSVIRHVDESHPHLHVYVLPADLRAARLHPGNEAKRVIVAAGPQGDEDAKALNRRGDQAYKAAMRAWQDSYHQHVGVPCGLARLGPGRRRLSREEWQAERSAAAATKNAIDRAAWIDTRAREHVAKAKAVASTTVAMAQERTAAAEKQATEAKALQAVAVAREQEATQTLDRAGHQEMTAKALRAAAEVREQKAAATLAHAGGEAERIVAAARAKASRISSWSGRLRAFFDGLRKSTIAETVRRGMAADLDRERARADEAARRALHEAERRREAERRARSAAESVQATARERDQARQELAALRPAVPEASMGRRMGR